MEKRKLDNLQMIHDPEQALSQFAANRQPKISIGALGVRFCCLNAGGVGVELIVLKQLRFESELGRILQSHQSCRSERPPNCSFANSHGPIVNLFILIPKSVSA